MDLFRGWMYKRLNADRSMNEEFANGVKDFIDFAFGPDGTSREGLILCPCSKCLNSCHLKSGDAHMHLLRNGFTPNYFVWYNHGESNRNFNNREVMNDIAEASSSAGGSTTEIMDNLYAGLVQDLFPDINLDGEQVMCGEEPNPRVKLFYEMFAKAQQRIWPANPMTILEFAATIAGDKAATRGSGRSADKAVKFGLRCVDPRYKHTLPQNWAEVKKFMLSLGLSHRTYDFCINHCFIYYKDGLHLDSCPTCGESRYEPRIGKGKLVAQRKMWFFPLTERLQRLYMCRKTAEHMIWHAKCKRRADPVVHPAGSEQWAHMDETFPEFAEEIRNVRLGLCTDGFDPHHGTTTNSRSIWPVFLTPYNLPPDLCMRPEFIFLTLLIQGPKDPSKDINVMLRPVVDECRDLWRHGALTYDSFKRENFMMKAYIFTTISDFPGYAMLSGWSTKGKFACPCCMQNTEGFQLKHSKKTCWFDGHRKFLPRNHPERRNRVDYIKGRTVSEVFPERMDVRNILEQVAMLPDVRFGKSLDKEIAYKAPDGKGIFHNWTKRSIFWELEYWPVLYVRHSLDVMHNEKNCFEMVHATMFDLGNQSKDTLASREDLKELTTRTELFITSMQSKVKAAYTLDRENTQAICEWLQTLRFPDGHCSNLGGKVQSNPWRTTKMKSHDCHVFMQRLLPYALKDFVPEKIWEALSELSNFFRAIPEISPPTMVRLGHSIILTLCKLEKIFPPSFFNSMEHIIMHLPFETMMLGPVYYHWMYPFERMMWVLKHNFVNQNRIEGSIAQAYLIREVANFTTMYSGDEITRTRRNDIGVSVPQFDGQLQAFVPAGAPAGKGKDKILNDTDYRRIVLYVVRNSPEFDEFVKIFDAQYSGMRPNELEITRVKHLVDWLRTAHAYEYISFSPQMIAILNGGNQRVTYHNQYMCNGYRWHTYDYGLDRKTMCSGVLILASGVMYYGMLREIVEVSFYGRGLPEQKICFFMCDWYDPRRVHTDRKYGFVELDSRRIWNTEEKFIFAGQAHQVYYMPYAMSSLQAYNRKRRGIWAVCPARPRHFVDLTSMNEEEEDSFYEDPVPPPMTNVIDDLSKFNVRGQLAEPVVVAVDENIVLSDVEVADDEEGDEEY